MGAGGDGWRLRAGDLDDAVGDDADDVFYYTYLTLKSRLKSS